jgi:basic membrane protein A
MIAATVAALIVAATTLSGSASGTAAEAPRLKVALIAPSARDDLAFTQSMYSALRSLRSKYRIELAVSENTFVVADAARLMHRYAADGYDLIVAHGSQYGETVRQLAPKYPKVSFAWGTSSSTFGLRNVYAYSAASNQGGYVQGYVAALVSKSKVIGAIGPVAVGDAKLYLHGFRAGALAADRKALVHVGYTGSFSDANLMAKRAAGYVKQGADVLTGSSQSVTGAISVCKARHVAWLGTQWSQAALAPSQVVSSQVYDWTSVLSKILISVRAGKLGGASYTITLRNGGEKIEFNPGYKLAPAVETAARRVIAGIEKGSIRPPQ